MKTIFYTAKFAAQVYFTKQVLVICGLSVFLTSCLGPRKIDKWVSKQYNETLPAATKKKSDYISITTTVPAAGNQLSSTKKKTSNFLPLIFYWQIDYTNTCTLNPQIPINNFTSTVLTYANKKLKPRSNGKRIELSLDRLPNVFIINDRGHMIWLVYAYAWDYISIQPEKSEMVVSYKILEDDGTISKTGTITVANADKGIALGMFQSLKKKTWEYLDLYNANITTMSRTVVDKLAAEL